MFTLFSFITTSATLASRHILDTLPSAVAVPNQFRDVPTAIGTIFNFVIVIAGTIFVILILVGGIQYLTSAGNEEGTGKAKRLLVDAIVGLILTLAAWAIGIFILQQVGLERRGFFIGSPPVIPPISNPGPGFPPIGPGDPGNPNGGGPFTKLQFATKIVTAANQPIQDAEIYFDGVLVGKTLSNGLRTFAIDTGPHTVEIIHGQYRTISDQNITLTEANRSSQLICVMHRDQDGSCQIQ